MATDSSERAYAANPMIDHTIREGFLHAPVSVGAAVEVMRLPSAPRPAADGPRSAPAPAAAAPARPAANAAAPTAAPAAQGGREVLRSARPPVVFGTGRTGATLGGSTLQHDSDLVETGGAKQRSKRLVRVVVPAGSDGPNAQQFELRALVLTNERDVLRYTAYRDPDLSVGFEPGTATAVAVTLREVQVLPARPGRPAEIHLRYEGVLTLHGHRAQFGGMIFLDGAGKVRATEPDVQGAGAVGRLVDGKVEIGWF